MGSRTLWGGALIAALALSPLWAGAQVRDIVVNLPFESSAGDTTFPPGRLHVQLRTPRLLVEGPKGQRTLLQPLVVRTVPRIVTKRTRLTFSRYGDKYFLSEVWLEGHSVGMRLDKSKAEEELEKNGVERKETVLTAK